MLKLTNTDRYQKDYKRYMLAINKIKNPTAKQKANELLIQFKTHSNIIDEGHSSRNNGNIDPRALRNNVLSLVEIRRKLDKLIQDSKEC